MSRLHPLLSLLTRPLALCLLTSALRAGAVQAAPDAATPNGLVTTAQQTVQVQDGDMASVLAYRLKPRGSTIEQMMVALLRANPDAFIQGNVNLLRDGAVLRLPAPEDVFRTSPEEAKNTVQRQHQNFLSDLEHSVAKALPPAQTEAAAPAPAPAAVADQAAEREALLEKLRVAKAHLGELQHNIQELERLTRDDSAVPAQPPAPPDTPVPTSWIWLGVAAIVAVMVGVGTSRRPSRPHPLEHPPQTDAAAEFQARLGGLNLNLGEPASPDRHL